MTSTNATCGTCATPVHDDPSGSRQPCPQCESLTRGIFLKGSNCTMTPTSSSGQITVTTYPQVLLNTARDLMKREEYGIAIVVAHMACEVAAERTISQALKSKSDGDSEESKVKRFNGFNLGNKTIRASYTKLTGDAVEEQGFWQAFKTSGDARNSIMHGGKMASLSEAEASLTATSALVAHLKK